MAFYHGSREALRVLRRLRLPFYNESQDRLRAPWRLAVQLGLFFALSSPISIGFGLLERELDATPEHRSGEAGLWILLALVAIASVWASCRWLDRRSMADLGLRIDRAW